MNALLPNQAHTVSRRLILLCYVKIQAQINLLAITIKIGLKDPRCMPMSEQDKPKVPRGILGGDVAATKAIKGAEQKPIVVCDKLPAHLKAVSAIKKTK